MGKRGLVALALSALALLCWAPPSSAVVAGTVAARMGCTLHEGFVNPCVIRGEDWGGTLYAKGVMGWFGVVTVPFAFLLTLGLLGWGAWGLLARLFRR